MIYLLSDKYNYSLLIPYVSESNYYHINKLTTHSIPKHNTTNTKKLNQL
jgi:hypothetical protein